MAAKTKTATKPQYNGTPEVTKSAITPLGTAPPKGKLVRNNPTPVDDIAMGFVIGQVWFMGICTAIGAWYTWQPEWFSIANFYWPLFGSTAATSGLVFHYFKRE